jgi:hypothetical protein
MDRLTKAAAAKTTALGRYQKAPAQKNRKEYVARNAEAMKVKSGLTEILTDSSMTQHDRYRYCDERCPERRILIGSRLVKNDACRHNTPQQCDRFEHLRKHLHGGFLLYVVRVRWGVPTRNFRGFACGKPVVRDRTSQCNGTDSTGLLTL